MNADQIMAHPEPDFQAIHLTCERGDRCLFTDVSFSLKAGAVLQVVGANGSGKTSLLRLLCGLSEPINGQLLWNAKPITTRRDAFHQALLYIGHRSGVKTHLTVKENLQHVARMHNEVSVDIEKALLDLQLVSHQDDLAGHLSAGQQRRIALARLSLLTKKCWILDEPLTAMDLAGIKTFANLLKSHSESGGITIFTSHQPITLENITIQRLSLDSLHEAIAT